MDPRVGHLYGFNLFHNLPGNVDGRGALLLFDSQGNDVVPVVAPDGIRVLDGAVHVGHIREMDHVPARQGDCDGLKALCVIVVISHADVQVLPAHVDVSGRYGEVRGSHDLRHRGHAQMVLCHFLRDQFHPDVAFLAAGQGHLAHGAQLLKLRHNIVVHICIQVFVHLAADRQSDHRLGVHIHFQDIRLLNVVRHLAADSVDGLFQVNVSGVDVGAVLVLDQHDGHIFLGKGLNRVHPVEGRDGVLLLHGDQIVDVVRACARVHGAHHQHGQLHLRSQLNLGSQKGLESEVSDGNQAQHNGHRPLHRKFCDIYHPYSPASCCASSRRTFAPSTSSLLQLVITWLSG